MEEKKEIKPSKKKIPRVAMPQQKPGERIRNFDEVELGLSAESAVRESIRCLQCKKPKCIEGCPVGIDIKSFIKNIEEKDFDRALAKIRENNALPGVCGRVCPQEDQCEKACILGIRDDPVAIGKLERFVADYELKKGGKPGSKNPAKADRALAGNREKRNKKMAVIGSGPAGLTCAGELSKMGYGVTIFEALHEPGGVLIYGIPEFRLPKSIVKKEVEYVKSLDVEIRLNSIIGKTYTINELLENRYTAVFIGTGAGLPNFLHIRGENCNGVYSASEYLTRANLMRAYLFPECDTPIKKMNTVSVVGGGNVALDAARTAKRLGAENVNIVYRRSEAEMPGRIEEIKHAKEEGIKMLFLSNPVEIFSQEGWVKSMRCIKMELGEPDESGRRRPIAVPGSEYEIKTDIVVIAIGQGANPVLTSTSPDIRLNKWGNIVADEKGKTNKKGVFAGGDIVTGSATVILAMGAGKIAAESMDEYARTGIW